MVGSDREQANGQRIFNCVKNGNESENHVQSQPYAARVQSLGSSVMHSSTCRDSFPPVPTFTSPKMDKVS